MGMLGDAFLYAWDNITGRQQNIDNQRYNYKMYLQQRGDNRHDAYVAYQRQKELLQNQQNFELETSDPRFQVSRMRNAGINPNLIAGQISPAVNTPSVPSAPQSSPSSVLPYTSQNPINNLSTLFSTVSQVFNMAKTKKETNKIDFDIEKIKSELNLTDAQTEKVKHESQLLIDELENIRPRQRKKIDADIQQTIENVKKTMQDIQQSQQLFPDQLLKLYYDTQSAYEALEQSRSNTTFLKKRLERFEKNFENIVKLDSSQIKAASLQSQSAAASSAALKKFIDSINRMAEIDDPNHSPYETMLSQGTVLLLNFLANWFMGKMNLPNISLPSDH